MGKVFVDVGMSLDGYIAGPNRGPGNPMGGRSMTIHKWVFATATFREALGIPGEGEKGPDDALVKALFARPGANVMGMRMFEEGEVSWPEDAPFHAPVFVLTHRPRAPWPRLGGTTFYFVADGIASALSQAKAASGGKDVRISGGADTIRQYLRAGLVDDLTVHIAPALLGEGLSLLEGMGAGELKLRQGRTLSSPSVAHIDYVVER